MNTSEYIDKESKYLMDTYARYPVVIEKGIGATCYDVEGKEYIDFGSGIGVNCLGYSDEGLKDAVFQQTEKLFHTSNLYYNPTMINAAEKLCKKTDMARVFFANSGAEANEGAIKLARKYSFSKYGENRNTIITLKNSFHGRTITTLSATGQDVFHNYFFPFTEGFKYALANDINSVLELIDNSVCALMLEFVQGEGGVYPLNDDFVKAIFKICKEKDILIIADEIQTGTGRTGKFLCATHYGVKPDIITLAKGLGGGLPIGAVLCSEELKGVLDKSSHGSTFGANPVSCAACIYVLEKIDDEFLNFVTKKGKYLIEQLKMIEGVNNIRGKGLMLAFDIDNINSKEFTTLLAQNGLLALTAKNSVRFLPPLNITIEEIDKGLEILKKTLNTNCQHS